MLDARRALTLAGLSLLGMVVTWLLAALVPATHARDAAVLADFARIGPPVLHTLAKALLSLLDTPLYVAWGAVLTVLAQRQGGWRMATAVLVLMACAPLSGELLKPLVAHRHASDAGVYIEAASWPSGHSIQAATLAWIATILAPPSRRRTVAFAGVLFASAMGCALLMQAWHMPSDVLGGYLLATLWASLASAALARRGAPGRASARRASAGQASEPEPWAPGSHSDSEPSPVSPLAALARMKSRSESLLR